jgi:hypothetical protein
MKHILIFLAAIVFCYTQGAGAQTASNTTVVPEASPTLTQPLTAPPSAATEGVVAQPQPEAAPMSEEEKAKRIEAIKKWHEMTPEQRQEAREKFKEAWDKLTPEQRAQVNKELRDKLRELTPEQRERLVKSMESYWKSLSPEEQQEIIASQKQPPPLKKPDMEGLGN